MIRTFTHGCGLIAALSSLSTSAFAQTATDLAQAQLDAQNIANQSASVALAQAKLNLATSSLNATPSGFSGAVSANQIAATAETNLLYSKLVPSLADKVTKGIIVGCSAQAGTQRIVIYTGSDKRSFADLRGFQATVQRFQSAIGNAKIAFATLKNPTSAPAAGGHVRAFFAPAVIAAAITAGSALVSLFKSDYTLGGASLSPTDLQLANLVAGKLVATTPAGAAAPKVFMFSEYTPDLSKKDVTSPLLQLDQDLTTVNADLATVNSWITALNNAKASDDKIKPYQDVATQLQTVIADYQTWTKGLSTADANGDTPLNRVNLQSWLTKSTSCSAYLHIDSAAGSNYSKKNLWTGLGGMPFYASAEATASWRVWSTDGAVAASGLAIVVAPFTKIDAIDTP